MPSADIFETEEVLTVVLEMPGVGKDNVDVNIENGVLTVEGRIDLAKYEGLRPVYTEYNVGPYRRNFRISSQVDQEKIAAEMDDGVITLRLPKAEARSCVESRWDSLTSCTGVLRHRAEGWPPPMGGGHSLGESARKCSGYMFFMSRLAVSKISPGS